MTNGEAGTEREGRWGGALEREAERGTATTQHVEQWHEPGRTCAALVDMRGGGAAAKRALALHWQAGRLHRPGAAAASGTIFTAQHFPHQKWAHAMAALSATQPTSSAVRDARDQQRGHCPTEQKPQSSHQAICAEISTLRTVMRSRPGLLSRACQEASLQSADRFRGVLVRHGAHKPTPRGGGARNQGSGHKRNVQSRACVLEDMFFPPLQRVRARFLA